VATSKRTLHIELAPELKAAIRRLPKRQRKQIGEVITAVRDGFGAPHLHSGLGIRRLRGSLFECRVGLKLRLVFDVESGVLSFSDLGTHDEIRKIIKNR
jgi:mRNA-degrading endonuclease YafQ of YafQ-DinJ toxin-antitoxin module